MIGIRYRHNVLIAVQLRHVQLNWKRKLLNYISCVI